MGLDMYLKAKRFLNDYSDTDLPALNAVKSAIDLGDVGSCVEVSIDVGYWRKANHIHKWFVDNVQKGIDECQESWVSRDKLKVLLEVCHKAIETQDTTFLPTESGFFFGSTDYDEYYWACIKDTITQIESVLNNPRLKEFNIYYQSSW